MTGWLTEAVAATFGTEPMPASFESMPRWTPLTITAPIPPPIAACGETASVTICVSTRGSSPRCRPTMTMPISR